MTRCALCLSLRQSASWRSVDFRRAGPNTALDFDPHAEVSERFPDLDATVIHLGGTRGLGVLVTMDDQQAADMVAVISPSPSIRYDDYTVFRSPLSDFLDEVRRRQLPGHSGRWGPAARPAERRLQGTARVQTTTDH